MIEARREYDKIGCYALIISIIKGCCVEEAFNIIEEGDKEDFKQWDKNSIEYLLFLYREGIGLKEISTELNRSYHSVNSKLRRLRKEGII